MVVIELLYPLIRPRKTNNYIVQHVATFYELFLGLHTSISMHVHMYVKINCLNSYIVI